MSTPSIQAVILGSARGIRRLDASQGLPVFLERITPDETALDWTLYAFDNAGVLDVTLVGGQQIQKIIDGHPSLNSRYHSQWQDEGEVSDIIIADLEDTTDCYFIRASTLFSSEALFDLGNQRADIAYGYYGQDPNV